MTNTMMVRKEENATHERGREQNTAKCGEFVGEIGD